MGYRYPTSRCRSLSELEDRVRELVRQLEPVILENRIVETTETVVAHGLGEVPGWVGWDPPHCVAIVRQTRAPDKRNVYLRATVRCVVNVRVMRAGPLLPGQMPNGGFHLTDWDPGGTDDDHLVKSSLTDATAVGGLVEKTEAAGGTALAEVTAGGVKKLQIYSQAAPVVSTTLPQPLGTAAIGTEGKWADGQHVHPISEVFNVDAMFTGYPSCAPSLWAGWTYSPSSDTWERYSYTIPAEVTDDVEPFVGMTLLAWTTGLTDHDDLAGAGVYVVNWLGGGESPAQIQRIYFGSVPPSPTLPYRHGMRVHVNQGEFHGGQTWQLATDDPIVLDTTEQDWQLVAGLESDHQQLTQSSRGEGLFNGDDDDCHTQRAVGHFVGVVADDWSSDGTVQNVPGTSVGVFAGESYRVYAELFMFVTGTEGYTVTVGGGPDAGTPGFVDGTCSLLHGIHDWVALATGWGDPTHRHRDLRYEGDLDDGGLVTVDTSHTLTGIVVHSISGIVHVTASGNFAVRVDSEPIDYHTSIVLEDSFFEVTRIA